MVRRIVNRTLLKEPVLDVEVANLRERGMLGIAIAKQNNATNQKTTKTFVFLYYIEAKQDGSDAKNGDPPLGNRLYRYELMDGNLKNGKLLLDIPAERSALHNGGKILIGPDSNVYLVVGDLAHRTRLQNYEKKFNPQRNKRSISPYTGWQTC
ncbi:hypothetical protein Ngar_c14940 [Candidatus Nitrososphaera gargensis Ga9.2]|uniref:Glucose/Sorbosone dehydrogenase domain-containing protein n=1 Tax=Nitrososphaera gargensis (strain Ga9.2) TaxID=1237085 RepID=K0IMY4_NITGG|nr:PQQ-dependent sugar dehydrogenase [Candidatus Nitrososphaera gargensis]AFU58429.1 hypothetical protein Ngar_c14940 [Candidatus Nitrososphaera gargensis Ga9.2]